MLLGATSVKAACKYVGEIDPWGQFQHAYVQLLPTLIPKAPKDTEILTEFLRF